MHELLVPKELVCLLIYRNVNFSRTIILIMLIYVLQLKGFVTFFIPICHLALNLESFQDPLKVGAYAAELFPYFLLIGFLIIIE